MTGALWLILLMALATTVLVVLGYIATKSDPKPLTTMVPATLDEYRRQVKRAESVAIRGAFLAVALLYWTIFVVLFIGREVLSWL